MPQIEQSSVRNRLLRTMSPKDFDVLAPALTPVSLSLGSVLGEPNEPIANVHFIEAGLISLLADSGGGRIEIGLLGFEGMTGAPIVLGTDRSPHLSLVQADGMALAVPAEIVDAALDRSRTLRRLLGRYIQSQIVQVGQTAYANADFTIDERLARWILMTQDRLERDELPLTHEFLASMLGVRRPGVTTATHILEGTGLIRAQRGRITVLDRAGLMELASDSYGYAEAEYERLLAQE